MVRRIMQVMQRILLMVIAVMFLVFGKITLEHNMQKRIAKQWEILHTERFLEKVCRTGRCTYEVLWQYYESLNYNGKEFQIRIEEYQKELDLEGNKYYYLILWEELQKDFMEEDGYEFEQGSVIRIVINDTEEYVGIISKEE